MLGGSLAVGLSWIRTVWLLPTGAALPPTSLSIPLLPVGDPAMGKPIGEDTGGLQWLGSPLHWSNKLIPWSAWYSRLVGVHCCKIPRDGPWWLHCVVRGVMGWLTISWMILDWPVVYCLTGDWSTSLSLSSPLVTDGCNNSWDPCDGRDVDNHILLCAAVTSISCTSLPAAPPWDVAGPLANPVDNNGRPMVYTLVVCVTNDCTLDTCGYDIPDHKWLKSSIIPSRLVSRG